MPDTALKPEPIDKQALRSWLGKRSIVLIGMMGAGKSSIGRRLGETLSLPFRDADIEIEKAAARSIPEIFAEHGEAYFRDGERRVIARLMDEGPQILATGGGAFEDETTRAAIAASGLSIWLDARLDVLMKRVRRKSNRPLLRQKDPESVMRALLEARIPNYRKADLIIESRDGPHDIVVRDILKALAGLASESTP
ncbi:MAG: shikimate kinase [Hyphomicrobiaceae bacterium]|nr:shikimate kinase [Hyphomicrobiaceae bacterium]